MGGHSLGPWVFGGAQAFLQTTALLLESGSCLVPGPRGAAWHRTEPSCPVSGVRGPPHCGQAAGPRGALTGQGGEAGEQLLEAWGRLWEGSSHCSAPGSVHSRGLPSGPLRPVGRGLGPGSQGLCRCAASVRRVPRKLAARKQSLRHRTQASLSFRDETAGRGGGTVQTRC